MCLMVVGIIFGNSQNVQAAQATSITSGDTYVIVSNGYALTVGSNGNLSGTKYTDGTTEATAYMKWKVTKTNNGYYSIYNEATQKYLMYKNYNVTTSTSTYDWQFATNGFYVKSGSWSYYLYYYNSYSYSGWYCGSSNSNTLYTVSTEPTEPVTYYPFTVNLFDYDTTLINKANPNGIQFNTGDGAEETLNEWTGWGKGPFTGIVEDSLSEGKLQFTNNYDQVGILDPDTVVSGKTTYQDVKLPFKYQSGYYTFDSDDYDVYFDGTPSSGATLVVNENQKTMQYDHTISIWQDNQRTAVGSGTGFFPFDGAGDTTPTYHFGMTFSTEFFMTENGYIDGDNTKDPISFEFSGDDDVWVFIDGKLVLDLGGIHDKVSGKLDFVNGTSQVYYENVETGTTKTEDAKDLWTLLGTTADEWRSSSTPHTLQVFYLERGKGASNCKIKFNLPQKNCVAVTKTMGNTTTDQGELDVLNNQSFTFQAYSKETGTETWNKFANKIYYLYDSNGNLLGGYRTGSNGEFTLKFGQTARFYMDTDIYSGKDADFYVEEINAASTKAWTASINGVQQGTTTTDESPELTIAKMGDSSSQTAAMTVYAFNCTNTVGAQANDDMVVLDYGKPVQIDVLANDTLFGDRTIGGVQEVINPDVNIDGDEGESEDTENVEDNFTENAALTNGNVSISGTKAEYKPTKFMDSVDRFEYLAGSNVDSDRTNVAMVSVIPATNVYYEDDFAVNNGGSASIVYSGSYETENYGTAAGSHQSDENTVYGQDAAYAEQDGFSDGSATGMSKGATATFTFNGTGVDIYTKTDNASPLVAGWIYAVGVDGNGNETLTLKQSVIVDNKYDVDNEALYQIPTICFDVKEYGTYRVKLQVMSDTTNASKYYLDGIRIYNPIDTENIAADDMDALDANSAYQLAGEAGPVVTEVRDLLLNANALTNSSSVNGVVYLDNVTNGTNVIADYEKDGPKNEVYLDSENAVAFTIAGYDDTQKVYLGVKAPEGKSSELTVTDGTTVKKITVTSASDMYFAITPSSSGNVVIQNTGNNLLSITKIRVTNVQANTTEEQATLYMVNDNTIAYTKEFAVMSLSLDESSDVENPDIAVDIDNPEDIDVPDASQQTIVSWVKNIISSFKKLIGKW